MSQEARAARCRGHQKRGRSTTAQKLWPTRSGCLAGAGDRTSGRQDVHQQGKSDAVTNWVNAGKTIADAMTMVTTNPETIITKNRPSQVGVGRKGGRKNKRTRRNCQTAVPNCGLTRAGCHKDPVHRSGRLAGLGVLLPGRVVPEVFSCLLAAPLPMQGHGG